MSKSLRKAPVDVTARGAIILGPEVTCDGFVHTAPYRVQTHVHEDHMTDFDTSKGYQDIYMSEATRELLIAELNADLRYRSNIVALPMGMVKRLGDIDVELLPSGHMLGAVQVAVTLPDGMRVGYSGDFQWPLDQVIQVDALVVDSTYGSREARRLHTRRQTANRLIKLVTEKLKQGPVFLKGHRGVIHKALEELHRSVNAPVLATSPFCREAHVYSRFGYDVGHLIDIDSPEGRAILDTDRYIRLYSRGDGTPEDPSAGTTILLNVGAMPHTREPVYEYSDRSYAIAMSGHGDFEGTLAFVKATEARYVVTDSTRGGDAAELARALSHELGIRARPSAHKASRAWGT
jgi:putative mRNA 3-end processing factor